MQLHALLEDAADDNDDDAPSAAQYRPVKMWLATADKLCYVRSDAPPSRLDSLSMAAVRSVRVETPPLVVRVSVSEEGPGLLLRARSSMEALALVEGLELIADGARS